MKLSLDRAFRVVWLVVGGMVLLVLAGSGAWIGVQWLANRGASDDAVRIARETQPPREESRAVRYQVPREIRGTATRLVLVSHGGGDEERGSYGVSGASAGSASWVNVIFVDDAGARPLLDRPAYIRDVDFPGAEEGVRDDIPRTWITYMMALEDSDGDGRLDARDETALYVTDLEGRALRRVLDPPLRHHAYQPMEGGRMLVYALEPAAGQPGDEKRMRQRAFLYDVAAGRLTPYAALDSAAARAAQVLAR